MACLQIEIPHELFIVILKSVIPAFCRKGCFFFLPENAIYLRDLWALFYWLLLSAVFLLAFLLLSERIRSWKSAPSSLKGGEILSSVFSCIVLQHTVVSILFNIKVLLKCWKYLQMPSSISEYRYQFWFFHRKTLKYPNVERCFPSLFEFSFFSLVSCYI